MTRKFVIHAVEQQYRGLHGIESWFAESFFSYQEAVDYAIEESYSVMDSYSFVQEYLEDQAKEWAEEEGYFIGSDEYYDYLEELRVENVEFDIYEVIFECPYTCEQIDKMLGEDPEGFVEQWCIEPDEDF